MGLESLIFLLYSAGGRDARQEKDPGVPRRNETAGQEEGAAGNGETAIPFRLAVKLP